ncbi:ABC transporter permease [Corynebacterium guangdongense]|uniref:ABC transport system permease protein n=1 Tax=Corynebacterium guangdongense TaxID=1783348 RepID=A0ABU1ZTW1_9CORY|nr:ABC transporter permease [Corynebacterium guangdongense]MDR7328369.1 putative ABC transport system permease protein [Corynebacterium guangdongense]WJZ16946.1 ABC transporter permease YtrF precursor [Corynebacterium guangdongense]
MTSSLHSLHTLIRLSWRAVRAHAARLALSVLAVVLGTAFVAGGFLLSASLNKAFTDITETAYRGIDVVVTAGDNRPLTDADLAAVRDLAGVDKAIGDYFTGVAILAPDGDPLQTGGAGAWLMSYLPPEQALTAPATVVEGRAPGAHGEAVLNDSAAESAGIGVGDTVTVIDTMGRTEMEIVGLSNFPISTGGWAGIAVTRDYYRENFDRGGGYFAINVRGTDSTSPPQLRDEVAALLDGTRVQTGQEAAEEQNGEIKEQLAFFTYILGAFGLIALLVGTFIIANTFSMTVGQRTRDFALLRAIGMSRRQLTGSVLVEALFTGLIGSTIGIGAGLGLVRLIRWAMDAAGFGFPDNGLALTQASVGFPILIGVLVTLVSAYVPALRAGRTHPVQAMRGGEAQTGTPVRARTIAGALLAAPGAAALVAAAALGDWATTPRMILTGLGAVLLLVGVLGLLAGASRRVFSTSRAGGPVLRLAESSLSRNPNRTAGTIFALTLGVSLVSAVTVLGASMTQSIYGAVQDEYRGDGVISTSMISSQSIPLQLVDELRAIDGVEEVFPMAKVPLTVDGRTASAGLGGGLTPVLTSDPRTMFSLSYVDGAVADPATETGVVIDQTTAESRGWSVGDELTVAIPDAGVSVAAPVLAVLTDNAAGLSVSVTAPVAEQLLPDKSMWFLDRVHLSYAGEGTGGKDDVHAEVVDLVNTYGVLQTMDRQEFIQSSVSQAQQLLAIVYALLALSVIIAILGVANTLALSIIERTREIGSLRAVGMQRGQVRRMILAESAQITLFGAVLGTALGTGVGAVLSRSMSDVGITEVEVPWLQLLAIAVGAALVGTLSGIAPARRAARVEPLAAVE